MIALNPRTALIAKVSKGKIKAGQIVTVSHPMDWETECKVINADGDEEHYLAEELKGFFIIERGDGGIVEIETDLDENSRFGGDKIIKGRKQLSKNVKSTVRKYTFFQDGRYYGFLSEDIFEYIQRDLTDEEIINIILEEIVYGVQPNLQESSMVGTSAKGLDKDPNYRNGYYQLVDGKEYTVTRCYGTIIIREGIDGGWYKGSGEVGRTIYEGSLDWERYRDAIVKQNIIRYVRYNPEKIISEFPEVLKVKSKEFKEKDYYKLSHEF
jgi:hypothetical protein